MQMSHLHICVFLLLLHHGAGVHLLPCNLQRAELSCSRPPREALYSCIFWVYFVWRSLCLAVLLAASTWEKKAVSALAVASADTELLPFAATCVCRSLHSGVVNQYEPTPEATNGLLSKT